MADAEARIRSVGTKGAADTWTGPLSSEDQSLVLVCSLDLPFATRALSLVMFGHGFVRKKSVVSGQDGSYCGVRGSEGSLLAAERRTLRSWGCWVEMSYVGNGTSGMSIIERYLGRGRSGGTAEEAHCRPPHAFPWG